MRKYLSANLLFIFWLLLSCRQNSLAAQDPAATAGEARLTKSAPITTAQAISGAAASAVDEVAGEPETALRYDFAGAAQIHQLVAAIQSKDTEEFSRILETLRDQERKGKSSPVNVYVIAFLRQYIASPEKGMRELSKLLKDRPATNWDWDSLLALNDILERLSVPADPLNQSLRQQVQQMLASRFAGIEAAYVGASIGRNELSLRAFRYVRRLPDHQQALQVCERLQKKLDNDFGLISISLERLYLLATDQPQQWRGQYEATLKNAHRFLSVDFGLRQQFPTAAPKVLSELSRLQVSGHTKLAGLAMVVDSCQEAALLLSTNREMGLTEKRALLTSVNELRAAALLDGYRMCKQSDSALVDVSSRGTFAASTVIDALVEVAEHYRGRSLIKFLDAQLSLAGIYLDSLQSTKSETNGGQGIEPRLLAVLDSIQTPSAQTSNRSDRMVQILESAQDIELGWTEWTMQHRRDLDAPSAKPPLSVSELLLERLEPLKATTVGNRKSRAVTGIGYLHLKYGEYQKAIDALKELGDGQQFVAEVIRCLALKDQGNIQAAQAALKTIELQEDSDVHKLQKLIVKFLEAELPDESMSLNISAITDLKGQLNADETFNPQVPKPFIRNMLRLNNEHQLALVDIDNVAKNHGKVVDASQLEESLNRAREVWKRHLTYTGANESFVRARAAYSLAVLQLTAGSAAVRAQKSHVEALIGRYRSALKDYEANKDPAVDEFNQLTKQREEIVKAESLIPDLEKKLIVETDVRHYCQTALRELSVTGSEAEMKRVEYPSLAFNILCLTLRVYLLVPDQSFKAQLSSMRWPLEKISREARRIATAQRTKIASDEVFGAQRDLLFERYRDAFDLAMELAVIEDLEPPAFLGAETTNQTVADLFKQKVRGPVSAASLTGKKFVSFFVGKHATHVFWRIADQDRICHHRVEILRSTLAETIQNYKDHHLSVDANHQQSTDAYADAYRLQSQLLCPQLRADLATAAGKDDCVYVIPHGPLFQLPIDTLPISNQVEEAKYLIEVCPPLVYLQSLARFGSSASSHDETYAAALLTIQPDDVGAESKDLFDAFKHDRTLRIGPDGKPESSVSIEAASEAVSQKELLLNELARGYRFVHFGSHGEAAASATTAAGRYLDGARLLLHDQESLTAAEVINRFNPGKDARIHTELVFLSACESQVSDKASLQYGGNTIQAMGTAFLVAGAQNVIASHWKVDNDSTKDLVLGFMSQVQAHSEKSLPSESYAQILHQQRKRLAAEAKFTAPYHWGPFTLSCTVTE